MNDERLILYTECILEIFSSDTSFQYLLNRRAFCTAGKNLSNSWDDRYIYCSIKIKRGN